MLLKLKDLIINTDHIIKAEYNSHSGAKTYLTIHMSDWGTRIDPQAQTRPHTTSTILLTDADAQLMWSMLSQLATAVVPAPPKKPQP